MGLLGKFTKKFVEPQVDDSAAKAALASNVGEMWDWLRRSLDAGCKLYLTTGNSNQLEMCLTGRALTDVITYLDQLRDHNVIWDFPDRDQQARTRIVVEEVIGSSIYIISEYFNDYSRLEYYQNDQRVDVREGDGAQTILRATIQTDSENNYYIADVALQSAL